MNDAQRNRGAPYHTPDKKRRFVARGECMGCGAKFPASGWQSQVVAGRSVEICSACVADGSLRDLQLAKVQA